MILYEAIANGVVGRKVSLGGKPEIEIEEVEGTERSRHLIINFVGGSRTFAKNQEEVSVDRDGTINFVTSLNTHGKILPGE